MSEFELAAWTWDIRKDRVLVDDAFRSFLGYAPDGRPVHFEFLCDSIHPQDLLPFRSAFESLVRGGASHLDLRCRMRSRWGEDREVATHAEVIERAPSGAPVRIGGHLLVARRHNCQRAA
jgi:PAS domain-containing protein